MGHKRHRDRQCSVTLGQIVMQRLINSFGEITMAACTAGAKIERYIFVPATGLQLGISTFTGQNLGAGKLERVKRGFRQTELVGLSIAMIIGLPTYIWAERLVSLFGLEGAALVQAAEYVRFCAPWCTLIFSAYIICAGLLQGAGDVIFTTFCSLSSLIVRIIFAYVMVYAFGAGHRVIWQSILIAYAWSLVFAWGRYFNGKWKVKYQAVIGSEKEEAVTEA